MALRHLKLWKGYNTAVSQAYIDNNIVLLETTVEEDVGHSKVGNTVSFEDKKEILRYERVQIMFKYFKIFEANLEYRDIWEFGRGFEFCKLFEKSKISWVFKTNMEYCDMWEAQLGLKTGESRALKSHVYSWNKQKKKRTKAR